MNPTLRRHFGFAALLLVSPALLAAKGCSFGSDDVPLGSNLEAAAGAAGDGNTGSSMDSGGSSNTDAGSGDAGETHTSATGGASSGAGTGGRGGGDSAGTGGITEPTPTLDERPCLEEVSALSDNANTPFGFSAGAALSFLAGKRAAAQYLVAGGSSTIAFEVVRAKLFHVESTPNPDFSLDIPVSCENHVRAVAVARFKSSDGSFDETFEDFQLAIGFDAIERRFSATGVFVLDRDELRGNYQPQLESDQCLLAVQFNVGFTSSELGGSLVESVLSAPCGSDAPNLAVLVREVGSFACGAGMDCGKKTPDPAVLIEANSCEGLGKQETSEGDEQTFRVDGSVITRSEDWGCGCPKFPEFILTFQPSSPVELRLCREELADSCHAYCVEDLSFDLATAFEAAGTTEFRFVD